MNDGENTEAIVAGMVTPFIFLLTVSAIIIVCWRWYSHSQCYFPYHKFSYAGSTSGSQAQFLWSLQPLVSQQVMTNSLE